MAKNKEEINPNGRAVFYTVFWESFRKAAIERGWALAMHGSMASDMDMMAMPWTEEARPVEELIQALSDCIGKTVWKTSHFVPHHGKPHGRVVYTLSVYSDYYIDLSILPASSGVPLSETLLVDFVKWYSGMQQEKIMKAYKRWEKENKI